MAKVYADMSGVLIRFLQTEQEEADYPDAPPGTVGTLEFDGETNAGIVQAINTDWNAHRLISGVLSRNGMPYTVAPDGQAFKDRKALATNRQLLEDYYARNNPTNAQTVAAVKALIRVIAALVRWYLKRSDVRL